MHPFKKKQKLKSKGLKSHANLILTSLYLHMFARAPEHLKSSISFKKSAVYCK